MIGILLTNTGTPDAPTAKAVRKYLKEFLHDRRIVKIPRAIWWPILYGLVLPFRAPRSTKFYQQIWTQDGSPMQVSMQQLGKDLQHYLQKDSADFHVEIGMNYGNPSISHALAKLHAQDIQQLIILPLYPQYSNATTASSFDRIGHALKSWRALPSVRMLNHYADNERYIQGLAQSVKAKWAASGRAQHLLISFHGIPIRFVQDGDPYEKHCQLTATCLAKALQLNSNEFTLCYQSQFGYDKWLQPSTQKLLLELPKKGVKTLDVICPGFSVDCLETLEEIALRGRESFIEAGGERFDYIPALNASVEHVECLAHIIRLESGVLHGK